MAHHSKTAFTFGPEFGVRLRRLRERRSLTLRAVAVLMDRQNAGAHVQLARLERGRTKYPSFNLIVDYLRACGAGFEDLLDLLNPHTSRRPVLKEKGDVAVAELLKSLPKAEQRAMLRWERATTDRQEEQAAAAPGKKRPKAETDQARVFRIVWSFIHANWNQVFEQKLYETMLKLKDEVPRSQRRNACDHARRFFSILTRHYQRESVKKSALEQVERRAKGDGFSTRVVVALLGAASEAYQELFDTGRLDWEPSPEEIIKRRGHAPKVEKTEIRLEMDEARPGIVYSKTLGLIHALAFQAVDARLDELKLDYYYVKQHYYAWIDRLIPIADEHGTGSPEWQAEVNATAPKLHDEAIAREAAALVANTFDLWKAKLPPRPEAGRTESG
ncbi:MAG: helix-turn-helix domain-containing protein [candidate division WOR-3 bacterium]|nr:helix-turn-helix domain-containing protein [candidate division WOR-3 bacterium]